MQLNLKEFKPLGMASPDLDLSQFKPDTNDNAALLGGITHGEERVQSLKDDNQSLESDAAKAGSSSGIATETAKGTVKSIIGGAGKFIASAANAPIDLVRGFMGKGPSQVTSDLFGEPVKTIQADAGEKIGSDIAGNKGGLQIGADAAQTVADTAFGAADVLGVGSTIEKGAKLLESSDIKGTAKQALEIVKPKLTKKETEQALAAGQGKGGGFFTKTKIEPDKRTLEVAKNVEGIVKKGVSGAENINSIKQALSKEAENLKTQIKSVDHPYSFKELNSRLSNVEEPISIKGTQFEKQIGAVKQAAVDIAKKNGGKISSLLDARKEFDVLVQKEYPSLYDKESAPMRNAITSIRNEINNFIEENIPDDVSLKNSLKKQSLYYDAIDNIAGKSTGEIGTSGLGRFLKNHPTIKKAANAIGVGAAGAVGAGGIYEGGKKILGQ